MGETFESYMDKKVLNAQTKDGYKKDIEQFVSYCKEQELETKEVKEMHIKQYVMRLKEKGLSSHTIGRKCSSLRFYFKYMRKAGEMVHNPMEDIKQPRMESQKQKVTEEMWETIIEPIQEEGNERDLLLMYLLHYDKIKISEIVGLQTEQYKEMQGILYLGKRAVPLHEKTKQVLDNYIKQVKTDYLFTNQHQKPLTKPGAYFVVKTHLKQAGLETVRPIDLSS